MMKNYNLLWILPFLISCIVYAGLSFFIARPTVTTPSLIGKSLQESLLILSRNGLNARIVHEKEDADLNEGTVLSQSPTASKQIKSGQTILLSISVKPAQQYAPNFIGLTEKEIRTQLADKNLIPKFFEVPSPYPEKTCVSQIPAPQAALHERMITCYISKKQDDLIIVPNMVGQSVTETVHVLQQYSITPNIVHTKNIASNHTCKNCVVSSQKPLPGSIISGSKLPNIQLSV